MSDKTITTVSGDMWDLLALKALGSEMYKDKLMKANKGYRYITVFSAGVVIAVPDVDSAALNINEGLPPWKRSL